MQGGKRCAWKREHWESCSSSSLLSTKINISLQWYKIIPMQQRLNELRKSLELNWDWSLKILTEF